MTCRACTAEADRWLDTTPQQMTPGLGYATQASVAYDLTPRGLADRRRGRYERWRTLVNDQRRRITDHCRAAGHPQPAPRVVTLDVLGP